MRGRWDALTVAALVMGVIAVSSSAPIIVVTAAPALAIAFWRNAFATALLAPVTVTSRRKELAGGSTHMMIWSGIALAVHFATWVPSVKLTSIATSIALVSTAPIWSGLIGAAQGQRLGWPTWLGMGIAITGVFVATGADLRAGGTALLGDVLALCGAIAGGIYNSLGERVRQDVSTITYTTVCYGTCAVALLFVCLAGGVPLTGYTAGAWLGIVALTLGPQLLGHSMFNYSLQKVPATTIGMISLLEVPGAALAGWLLLGQRVSGLSLAGIAILLVGLALVIVNPGARSARRRLPASDL